MPGDKVGVAGVTATDTRTAGVTWRVAVPVTPLSVALIVVLPTLLPVAVPVESIVATAVLEEAHVAVLEMSFELPSL
jgi:hypothetical protein